ncbi:MAG: hypothetical protein EOP09_04910 [Proteobacteria bacterium]|nr:MAG: hypothetical protein EOP09_04910 [Pseudomonadota bacterium]
MLKSRHVFACCTFIFALLGTLSCSAPKEEPKESVDSKLSADDQRKLDEARAEMEIGRNMAGRLIKYYGAYPDEKLVRYVNEVGALVSRSSDYPDRKFMFEVYYSDDVNAFACPGGYILISLGAIKNASNEAELAHVLGHEIAHVGKKHMFNALSKMSEEELKKEGETKTKFGDLPIELQARKRPTPQQSEFGALVARYISGSSAGLNILQAAKAGMSLITEKGLGADLEYEADREGTKIATNAGYYSKGLVNFLCRIETHRGHAADYCLQKQDSKDTPKSILDKTHPSIPDRVLNIKDVLKAMNANEVIGAKGRKRYVAIKERIKGVNTSSSDEEKDTAEPTPEAKKD